MAMSNFKMAFLFFAAVLLSVCLQNNVVSADDADALSITTDSAAPEASDVAVPQGQETIEGEKVIHGRVFTVPTGEDHYIPYGSVHGTFTKDGQIVAEFTTDEL